MEFIEFEDIIKASFKNESITLREFLEELFTVTTHFSNMTKGLSSILSAITGEDVPNMLTEEGVNMIYQAIALVQQLPNQDAIIGQKVRFED